MPTETTWVYPAPKSWDEFEGIVWDLFRRSWQDPEAQRYGRSGQEQHGIDVYGRPKEMGGAYVGVQCKRYEDGALTEKVIRGEISKVEKGINGGLFPIKPAEFIIATTASRDVKLQDLVIRINEERKTSGVFPVYLRFWEDLTDMLASPGYEDLRRKHYPTLPHVDEKQREATPAEIEQQYKTAELILLKQAVKHKLRTLETQVVEPIELTGNPYPFGKALGLNYGEWLVGRDECVRSVVSRLKGEKTIFLAGEGGVGKTSLLRAGLIPALLKNNHLPLLLAVSDEPVDLSLKRQFVQDIESTKYLIGLSLCAFLQAVGACLSDDALVVLLLDRFEALFNQSEPQKAAFKKEWLLTISSEANIRWLFSIQLGDVSQLSFFKSEEVDPISDRITLSPLDRKSAQEGVQLLADRGNIKLDQTVVGLILDELGVTSINPSQLQNICYFMSGGNGPLVSEWTNSEYERLGKTEGILQNALEWIIRTFPIEIRQPAWQILACLAEDSNRRLTEGKLANQLKLYGFSPADLPHILEYLEVNHLIDLEDEGYRLANTSIKPRLQQWRHQQAAGIKARNEAARQIDQSRKTALRGLIGGALGFALFDTLVYTGQVLDALYMVLLALIMAAIGGLAGILLTLNIDLMMAAYLGKPFWFRYVIGGLGGAVALTIGSLLYVLTFTPPNSLPAVLPVAAIEGAIWGLAVGSGAAWVVTARRGGWLQVLAVSVACGLILLAVEFLARSFGFSMIPELWNPPFWRIFLGGALTPFFFLAAVLFGRINLEDGGAK